MYNNTYETDRVSDISIYLSIYLYVYIHIYIHIHIYRDRDRERVSSARERSFPSALRAGPTRFFQFLDLYWHSRLEAHRHVDLREQHTTNPSGHLWRDQCTALSGPLSESRNARPERKNEGENRACGSNEAHIESHSLSLTHTHTHSLSRSRSLSIRLDEFMRGTARVRTKAHSTRDQETCAEIERLR